MRYRSIPVRSRRRVALAVAAAATAVTLTALMVAQPATAAPTLRGLAEAQNRYFGTALTDGNLGDSTLTNVAGAQFDMVTPGNEMKWDTTEPSNGGYNFGPGDQIVTWAKSHSDRGRQPLCRGVAVGRGRCRLLDPRRLPRPGRGHHV